jgi:hypothetical protein
MKFVGHVARMGEMIEMRTKFFIRKLEKQRPPGDIGAQG